MKDKVEVGIIGGTGVYDPSLLEGVAPCEVETPYGRIRVYVGRVEKKRVAFLPRHGETHGIPPHRINFRGNIWALKELGVKSIFATSAVGSLNSQMKPGQMVILDQFLDFTKARPFTFHDGGEAGVVHVDFTHPYCLELRKVLIETAANLGITAHPQGVYVCTEGPRYETPAEIKAFQRLGGDVVGMTGVPEVVLAREAEICYASVAVVTNWAAGISPVPLTHQEVVEIMQDNSQNLRQVLWEAVRRLPVDRDCACHHALREQGKF